MPKWDSAPNTVSSVYMTRSPKSSNKFEFCFIYADGGTISQGAAADAGIAPMVCI